MTKILIGVFSIFILFLFLIPLPVFAQTASSIPAPILNSAVCSALPRASISWSGQPTNNQNSWCNGGFIVDVSTNPDFSSIYNKCVPANIQAASYSTVVPDGFSGGLILRSGLTYYARVNNDLLSNTRSFTCPATGTQATPTPTPSLAPVVIPTLSPVPSFIPTSTLTPTIAPALNTTTNPTNFIPVNPSIQPSEPPLTSVKVVVNLKNSDIELGNYAQNIPLSISDPNKEQDVLIRFTATYSDKNNSPKNFFLTFHYKPKQQIGSSDIPVDVIIHKSLTNQDEVANWAKDTINNYINTRFSNANIKHRLRVDQVIMNYDDQNGCPAGSTRSVNNCIFSDESKIRIWLYKNGSAGAPPISSASLDINQVRLNIPAYGYILGNDPLSEIDRRTLTHEIGHLFKMPDYYKENMHENDNHLTPGIGITPYSKDIMWSPINYDFFSETSKGFADRTTSLPAGDGYPNWNLQYLPKNIVLKIIDNNNPARGALVEVFPQTLRDPVRGGRPEIISPDVITVSGTTNDKGEINLGSYNDIFQQTITFTNGRLTGLFGNYAYIRITYNNQTRYAAFTLSYLNDLYFKGYTDTAVLDLPFSSLTTYETGMRKALSAPGQISTIPSLSEQERQLLEEHIKQDLPTPRPIQSPVSSPAPNPYDLNGDGVADKEDTAIFIRIFQSGKYDEKADFNHDEVINIVDYSLLVKNFK